MKRQGLMRSRSAAEHLSRLFLPWVALSCASLPKRAPPPALAQPAALADAQQRELPNSLPLALAQDEDYVVRVVADAVVCSGTLIEEDRVLTAHHCVARRGPAGNSLKENVAPDAILVELGGDHLPWGEVGVRAVVAPPCGFSAGDGDIAILVLERRLIGVATVAPRLDREPELGEHILPIGFGQCSLSADAVKRKRRAGGRIEARAPFRFQSAAAICPGDSGGPALGESDDSVVGVISASVMDESESTRGRTEFTRLDRFRPVFAAAQLIAEGTSPAEIPPLTCEKP